MKRNMKYRLLSIFLCIAVITCFSFTAVFADSAEKKTPVANSGSKDVCREISADYSLQNDAVKKQDAFKQVKKNTYVIDNDEYILWNAPTNFVLYKGEKLYVDFTMYDTWSSYFTIPSFDVYEEEYDYDYVYSYAPADSDLVVAVNDYDDYSGYFNIGSNDLDAGDYYIALAAMPCYSNGVWPDDLDSFDIPIQYIDFKIKKLSKPTSLKVTAGKKRVTITYKKATGAQKYEIYRSTSKNSGYKKIATTSKTKYIDKKAKKGKKYYYKVRAKRGTEATGIAYSFYTTPKRSGKVK